MNIRELLAEPQNPADLPTYLMVGCVPNGFFATPLPEPRKKANQILSGGPDRPLSYVRTYIVGRIFMLTPNLVHNLQGRFEFGEGPSGTRKFDIKIDEF